MNSDDTSTRIAHLIQQQPDGAAIGDIEEELDLHRRTIQRRLKKLINAGEVRREGKGRATRYFADSPPAAETPSVSLESPADETVEPQPILSTEGAQARREIQRPIGNREPVGYQPRFLDAYLPNKTRYLVPIRKPPNSRGPADLGIFGFKKPRHILWICLRFLESESASNHLGLGSSQVY